MRKRFLFPLLVPIALVAGCSGGGGGPSPVDPPPSGRAKWTVIVFLNAANDLHPFSTANVDQMERVAGNPNVRFVVQWKQSKSEFPESTFDGTRRLLVTPNTTSGVQSPVVQNMGRGVDMGRPETLRDFIVWAKTKYPADHYALVVWNHGNGWRRSVGSSRGVSLDDETGNVIHTWEIAQALGDDTFDILAWDASLMQMAEVAHELVGRARYVAGSEESPPGAGYPYDEVFRRFRDDPDADPGVLAKGFVDAMLGEPSYNSRKITQSVIDTTRLENLAAAVDALGRALITNRDAVATLVPTVRSQAQRYGSENGERYYRDLVDVCTRLEAGGAPTDVVTAAANVRAAVAEAVIWEGHNANSPGSRGIAIDFGPSTNFAPPSPLGVDYTRLRFGQQTSWDEWLAVAP